MSPIFDAATIEIFSRSADQTRRLGMRLGRFLQPGDIVCLSGDLGAGKTTLIQGVAQGWGTADPVTSPTFVLINEYSRPDHSILFHMDAYRIANLYEAEELDMERMMKQGPILIEWAERIESILPADRLTIQMSWISDEQRRITLFPMGKRFQSITQTLRQSIFGV